jgi:hypothetical protein
MGGNGDMIKKGTLVKRWTDDYCVLRLGLKYDKLVELYPPERSLCIVTSGPKESDLSTHDRHHNPDASWIALKKSIEVICDGKWHGPCDISAFEEIKK